MTVSRPSLLRVTSDKTPFLISAAPQWMRNKRRKARLTLKIQSREPKNINFLWFRRRPKQSRDRQTSREWLLPLLFLLRECTQKEETKIQSLKCLTLWSCQDTAHWVWCKPTQHLVVKLHLIKRRTERNASSPLLNELYTTYCTTQFTRATITYTLNARTLPAWLILNEYFWIQVNIYPTWQGPESIRNLRYIANFRR